MVGSSVRVRRPISHCTGEVPNPSLGVLHQARMASNGSFTFTSSALQVLTAFSAFLFDCRYLGLNAQCSNFLSVAKFLKFWLENSGPLSVVRNERSQIESLTYRIPTRQSCKPVFMHFFKLFFSLTDDLPCLNKD